MDKTSLDTNNASSQQDPPTPRAAGPADWVAAANAVIEEMCADPEWRDKLPTYSANEVMLNPEAAREFSRRYSEKLGVKLEFSEGVVGVTLALLCDVHGVDMDRAFEIEITRVSDPEIKAKVRAKQEAKPNDICGDYKE